MIKNYRRIYGKKKNSISVIYKSYPKNKRRITIPCSPKLLTKFRTRPSMYKGHEEQELEDFKKQPKFHALPLNNKIFHKTFGIPEYGKKLLTIPHSPNLTKKQSKYSIQSSKECLDKISDKNCFSFNSCIYHDKKILKRISSHNNQTLISSSLIPFHLPGDDISKKKILEFKEKMQKEKEESERLRHFIAHPIPNKNEKNRRSKSILNPIPLVQPIPFNLITEKRGIQYQEDFQNNIIRKQKEEDKLRKFVAKPPISLFKIPFIISKSNKPLTEFKEINFETDIRAKKWIKYENHLKEKAKEIEKIKKQQEEYKKLCEKQWIKEQRKKTIIHANPIPSYIYKTLKKNNT